MDAQERKTRIAPTVCAPAQVTGRRERGDDRAKPMTPSAQRRRTVADVIGAAIAAQGARDAFGVLGSGNLVATNALVAGGTRFHHARHEGAAICMADGYARVTGTVGVCSVHQGPGLTNAITGLAEAAKSRTPLLVLAGDTPAAALTSNLRIDQHNLVESVGAIADRVHSPQTAADDVLRAHQRARVERRPVVLMLATDIQAQPAGTSTLSRPAAASKSPHTITTSKSSQPTATGASSQPVAGSKSSPTTSAPLAPPQPSPRAIAEVADLLAMARRPAIIAGRGAVLAGAGQQLEQLGAQIGAVLATSAPANGLFHGLPYALGISGGFASPFAAELLTQADVMLVFGASLNDLTTRHGALINGDAKVVQFDLEPSAIGRNRPADLAVIGDAWEGAQSLQRELERRSHANAGFRTQELAREINRRRWRHEPYDDASTDEWIDPRTFSIALNEALPPDRAIVVDSGHFLGWPSMYLDVPDPSAWVFANGFQAVGLGLGNAIGAAVANPDRATVAAIGDGGAFMTLAELETAVRLHLGNLLVVIYDDAAYGAEVHHFAPLGHDVSLVRFPGADLGAIAHAAGAKAAMVRSIADLEVVGEWLDERWGHPLVLDAKVNAAVRAEWLEEAFRVG